MIPEDRQVMLASGETVTAGEVFEGLARLAKNDSAFPLMSQSDKTKAVISVAFEALEWADERGIL